MKRKTKSHTAGQLALGIAVPMTLLADAVRDYVQNYLVPGKKLGK